MTPQKIGETPLGDAEIREHAELILGSKTFADSSRRRNLFAFLVNAALSGDTVTPEGIASFVYPEGGYDVRVYQRLRTLLTSLRQGITEFDKTEGRHSPLEFSIEGYAVLARRRSIGGRFMPVRPQRSPQKNTEVGTVGNLKTLGLEAMVASPFEGHKDFSPTTASDLDAYHNDGVTRIRIDGNGGFSLPDSVRGWRWGLRIDAAILIPSQIDVPGQEAIRFIDVVLTYDFIVETGLNRVFRFLAALGLSLLLTLRRSHFVLKGQSYPDLRGISPTKWNFQSARESIRLDAPVASLAGIYFPSVACIWREGEHVILASEECCANLRAFRASLGH